jgi:bacterioferritin (cytochrome b1)
MSLVDEKKLIPKINSSEVIKIKKDLIELFDMEVLSRDNYFQQLRRFDGIEFETIKWLSEQEARHIQLLELVLSKANILVKEKQTPEQRFNQTESEIISIDLEFEDKTTKQYDTAANKTMGALKELLLGIMKEEENHIERLKKYVK